MGRYRGILHGVLKVKLKEVWSFLYSILNVKDDSVGTKSTCLSALANTEAFSTILKGVGRLCLTKSTCLSALADTEAFSTLSEISKLKVNVVGILLL